MLKIWLLYIDINNNRQPWIRRQHQPYNVMGNFFLLFHTPKKYNPSTHSSHKQNCYFCYFCFCHKSFPWIKILINSELDGKERGVWCGVVAVPPLPQRKMNMENENGNNATLASKQAQDCICKLHRISEDRGGRDTVEWCSLNKQAKHRIASHYPNAHNRARERRCSLGLILVWRWQHCGVE